MSTTAKRNARIRNRLGLHARAAVTFVKLANKFGCEVKVAKDDTTANGKSPSTCRVGCRTG